MADNRSSEIHLSSQASRGFSASPADADSHIGRGRTRDSSGSRFNAAHHTWTSHGGQNTEKEGSSNFLDVLRERVHGVLDAHHHSSARISDVGSVSRPTATTDIVSHGNPNASSSSGAHRGPSHHSELELLPLHGGHPPAAVQSETGNVVRSAKLQDYYSIEWVPKELFLKFRQQVEGFQLGANFEFEGWQAKEYNTKLVFKPVRVDRRWKFCVEPKHGDMRLLTKKIPIGSLLNVQIGIGHDWNTHTTGWKWKLTSAFGGDGATHIRHKSLLPVAPGFDLRVGWNAEYVLPDLHGALGTGDPTIGMNLGHLYASVERLEAIYTHMT